MLHLQSRLHNFELIKAGRKLLKEGELHKISRNTVAIRYIILLSDCLLYTTYVGAWVDQNTGLRVGYTIPIGDLQVRGPSSEHPYPEEFFITSSVRSFIIRAKWVYTLHKPSCSNKCFLRSIEEREEWVEAISSAQEAHFERLITFVLDPIKPSVRTKRASLELGDAAPVWVPDERVTNCQSCDVSQHSE